jgi:hypothetical protein
MSLELWKVELSSAKLSLQTMKDQKAAYSEKMAIDIKSQLTAERKAGKREAKRVQIEMYNAQIEQQKQRIERIKLSKPKKK